MKVTVTDLFCGAGGFSEGFRQAGCSIVLGVDNWEPAINTFKLNFPNSKTLLKDIGSLSKNEINELIPNTDILIGSPPCQIFSTSNQLGKAKKTQGIFLIKSFLKIVVIKKHNGHLKAWFMENVPNFLNSLKNSYTYAELNLSNFAKTQKINPKSIAIKLNKEKIKVLSALDFGVAQSRNRAFIGEIIDFNRFPSLDKIMTKSIKNLKDLFSKIPAPNNSKRIKTIVDPNYPNLSIKTTQLTDHFYDTGLYEMQWRDCKLKKLNHPFMGNIQFPENFNKPSRTVTTNTGYSREALVYKSEIKRKGNGEYREPTIRELALIMSFPLNYQCIGSNNQKRKLIGNAVCPKVSYGIALSTLKSINKKPSYPKFIINKLTNHLVFINKNFNKPPVRRNKAKYRRHIFKKDGISINLSNFNIERSSPVNGKWFFSVFLNYNPKNPIKFNKNRLLILEKELSSDSSYLKFKRDLNKLYKKTPNGKILQSLYEMNDFKTHYTHPDILIQNLENIVLKYVQIDEYHDCSELKFFPKKKILKSQLYSIYGIYFIEKIINNRKDIYFLAG